MKILRIQPLALNMSEEGQDLTTLKVWLMSP